MNRRSFFRRLLSAVAAAVTLPVVAKAAKATASQPYIPTGAILDTFDSAAVPEGFLLCNGAAVSRETYAKLFGVLGEHYGRGDGQSTFNVPDIPPKPFRDAKAWTWAWPGASDFIVHIIKL